MLRKISAEKSKALSVKERSANSSIFLLMSHYSGSPVPGTDAIIHGEKQGKQGRERIDIGGERSKQRETDRGERHRRRDRGKKTEEQRKGKRHSEKDGGKE
jgi:hypothetical protein